MTKRWLLTIRLTLAGPVLTQSTSMGRPGVDSPFARQANGELYLPFSLVKGRLRQSLEELTGIEGGPDKAFIEQWLGPEHPGTANGAEELGKYVPQRAAITFSDFRHEGDCRPDAPTRTRIQLDPNRGAVREGMMQALESPFASGERGVFAGEACFHADQQTADEVRSVITNGLRWTPFFGAETGVGFGKLLDVEIDMVSEPLAPAGTGPDVSRVFLAVRPLTPFCVAKRRVNGNTFESNTVLSGAVLKGVVATSLARRTGQTPNGLQNPPPTGWEELARNLSLLRFAHAFPATDGPKLVRPVVWPASTLKANNEVYDAALLPGPTLIHGRAPEFGVDWKDASDVEQAFGWPEMVTELRVRTKIDKSRRRAEDERLFAYEMVVPDSRVWLASVDFSALPPQDVKAAVAQFRQLAASGWECLGKTKSPVTVEELSEIPVAHESCLDDSRRSEWGEFWVLTVQTPTLLCDPHGLSKANDDQELFDAYRDAFEDISGESLELIRFFARQSLAGGYQVHRFRGEREYEPYLLTDPGAVFVLRPVPGRESAAADCIQRWYAAGLPLPQWAEQRYETEDPTTGWRTCPFRPQEGFGEIAVNLAFHIESRPDSEDCRAVP